MLNQEGKFKCPNGAQRKAAKAAITVAPSPSGSDTVAAVMANLRQRGTAKPKTLKKLMSTIRTFRKDITEEQLAALVEDLQTEGFINIDGSKVAYGK